MITYVGTKLIEAVPCVAWQDSGTYPKGSEGYKVVYEDGYIAWSPKDVFEKAYRTVDSMNFGLAIEATKLGYNIARKGWNGKGIFVALQTPDSHSKMSSPYLYIDTSGLDTDNKHAPKTLVPWLASQTDMLADDWCII